MITELEGFETYPRSVRVSRTVQLPRQRWWRRLFGQPRPAGTLYVHFCFQAGEGWKSAEAHVDYPEGVDRVTCELQTFLDGDKVILFDEWPLPLYSSPQQ